MTQPEKSVRAAGELFAGEVGYSWTDEGGDECLIISPESRDYVQIVIWDAESEPADTRSVFIERAELPSLIGFLTVASE